MTGLPDISLSESGKGKTVADLKEECADILSDSDKKLLTYFFLKYDCQNVVRLLKNPDSALLPNGNYSPEQYGELIQAATETDFNDPQFPDFMSDYVREYADKKDKEGFFAEDAMMLAYYKYAMDCPDGMIAQWYEFNFNVTNILTALIARKYGWKVDNYIQGENDVTDIIKANTTKDFNLGREYDFVEELMKVVEETDPVMKEKKMDAFRWAWLDERTFFDAFSIEALFAYFCKLEMLERWEHLDVEQGKETFTRIIENLRGEARVPDEFVR